MITLTPFDLESELFRKFKKHYEGLLSDTQRDLEKNLSIEQTASLRGRAKLLRQLINIEDKNNVRID